MKDKWLTVVAPSERLRVFLSCYPVRVIFGDGNEGQIGRGSLDLIRQFSITYGKKQSWPLIEIGNFCEAARCCIQIGGEHDNSLIFNHSLGTFPLIRAQLMGENNEGNLPHTPRPTKIGHGVILSRAVTVIPGAQIGNGSVIGAGSVVSRSAIAEYGIAVGSPARVIRKRISMEQQEIAKKLEWWNWDIEFLMCNIALLQEADKYHNDLQKRRVMSDDRYRLVMEVGGVDEKITSALIGYEDCGTFIPLKHSVEPIRNYFNQLSAPADQKLTWVPNIFRHVFG